MRLQKANVCEGMIVSRGLNINSHRQQADKTWLPQSNLHLQNFTEA